MIPDGRRDKYFMLQLIIFGVAPIQAEFIGFVGCARISHAQTPLLSESQWVRQHRDWHNLSLAQISWVDKIPVSIEFT